MSTPSATSRDFRDWQIVAVKLLQGVVYVDEERVWNTLLNSRSQLETFLGRLGLLLVVDESEGYAFVRQWSEEELPEGYEELPRLMRRVQLGYGPTLLAVILRDEFRRFEDQELHDERCVIEFDPLFEQWKTMFSVNRDEVRQKRELVSAIHKLEELGFVRKFSDNPESWEVRRILKARLPAAELELLKVQLTNAAALRASGTSTEGSNA